jgi:hypothetical protein
MRRRPPSRLKHCSWHQLQPAELLLQSQQLVLLTTCICNTNWPGLAWLRLLVTLTPSCAHSFSRAAHTLWRRPLLHAPIHLSSAGTSMQQQLCFYSTFNWNPDREDRVYTQLVVDQVRKTMRGRRHPLCSWWHAVKQHVCVCATVWHRQPGTQAGHVPQGTRPQSLSQSLPLMHQNEWHALRIRRAL